MWQLFSTSSTYRKRARFAAILWTLLILFLCLMPAKDIPHVRVPLADKWVHFIFFGGFSFLWLCAYPVRKSGRLTAVFFTSVAFGAFIELLQWAFSALGRSADWLDIVADAIGGLLGVLLFYTLSRVALKKLQG
jgi:VanZ family protein